MSFGISTYNRNVPVEKHNCSNNIITCYTPVHSSMEKGTYVSMVKTPTDTKTNVIKDTLAVIPAGAIIDMVEYSGINSFSATGTFSIGIGQLNHTFLSTLVSNGTSLIANGTAGGCRNFISDSETGENNKIKVPSPYNINFISGGGVQSGNLRIDIFYHVKS